MSAKVQPTRRSNAVAAGLTVAALLLLFLLPVAGAPLLIVLGIGWRSGPLWARLAMVTIAVTFGLWFLFSQPFHL